MADQDEAKLPGSDIGSINELERLRDILYGEQARSTEQRLSDLEINLEKTRDELHNLIQEVREAVGQRLDDHAKSLDDHAKSLDDQAKSLDNQAKSLDDQAKSSNQSLESTQQTLSQRLDQIEQDHTKQLNALKKKLTGLIDELEANKVPRTELSDMFAEIGKSLANMGSDVGDIGQRLK